MQFTPDGKSLVLSGWSGIKLVDSLTGRVAKSIEVGSFCESGIALTKDGNWVAAQLQ